MNIDIITFTNEQYATLNEAQLKEVYEAQEKKNRLSWKRDEEMEKEKYRLVKNGTFVSGIWSAYCAQKQAEYEREVDILREALLYYLRYSVRVDGGDSAPYLVDYALEETERARIVKEYYDTTYTDAEERFTAFKEDLVAVRYLGEMYAPIWDYFYLQTTASA